MLLQVRNIGSLAIIAFTWWLNPLTSLPVTHSPSASIRAASSPSASLPAVQNTRSDIAHSYLALGDSYTIGESVDIADRYPVQAVRLMRAAHVHCIDPEIIATTGWTTANLLEGIDHKMPPVPPYDIVTLLIGVNNQFQGRSQSEYRQQFASLVQESIELAGNRPSHVIVLSIPDYSVTPFAQGSNTAFIASQIDAFNTINAAVSAGYKVNYLDITGESRKAATDPSLIASDGLHFSGKEYGVWADLMQPMMKGMLK